MCSAPSPYFDWHTGTITMCHPHPKSVAIGHIVLKKKIDEKRPLFSLSRALIHAHRLPRPWLNRSIESVITKLHDIQWTTKRSSGRFNHRWAKERGSQANPSPKKGTKKTEVWLFSYFIFCQKKKKEKRRSIHHIQSGVERNEWAQDTRKRNLKKKFKKKRKFRRTKTGQMSWVTHSGLNWDPFSNGTSTEEQAVVIELLSSSLSHWLCSSSHDQQTWRLAITRENSLVAIMMADKMKCADMYIYY